MVRKTESESASECALTDLRLRHLVTLRWFGYQTNFFWEAACDQWLQEDCGTFRNFDPLPEAGFHSEIKYMRIFCNRGIVLECVAEEQQTAAELRGSLYGK